MAIWFNILAMAPSPDTEACLNAMSYRDLQKVAKQFRVKANLARVQLIQKILEAKSSQADGQALVYENEWQ